MDFLGGLFETKAGRGAAASGVIARATGASYGARNGGQPLGVVGPWDTEQAIKQGYERVIWIFRCVDVIAQNQASRKIIFRDGLDRRTGKAIKDDRLNKVLNFRSNVYESSWQFRYRLSTQLLLSRRGAFIEIVPARDGQPAELHLLPVGQTRPIPDPKTFVSGYEVTRSDNVIDTLKPEQVIWVRTKPHPSDNYAQVTPLSVAGIEADTDYLARIFNRNFLMNDGRPGMLITIDPGELNLPPADMEIIKQRFSGGPTAAGQTTVIEAAGISAQDLSASPRDIQWDTLLTSTKERILMAFGVPESVMGNASGRTFDNADAERENFWMDTMIPHCDNIAFSLDILTGDINDNKVCAFDYDDVDVLQRVAAARREEWRTEVQQGLRTVNEYFDDAAREPWSGVLRNDVLYLPNGVVVARNPVQQEEANKFVPAKPEGAAGGGESQGQVSARAQTTALNRATAKWGNQIAARLLSGGVKNFGEEMETKAANRGDCKYCGKPGTRYIVNRKNGAKSAVCKDHIKMGKNRTKRSGKGKRADASRVGAVEKKSDHDRDLEVFLDGVLTGWDLRQADVVSQRLVHVKSRKGTRHWDDGIETKALDPRYALDLQQWRSELLVTIEEQVYKTIDRTAREVQAQLRQTGDLDDLVQQGQAGKAGDLFTRLFGVGSTERTTIFDNVMKTVGDAADNNSQRILDKITAMDAEGASMAEIQRYVKDTISNRSGWRKMLAANVATTTKEQTKEVLYGAVGGSWKPTWNSAHDERVRASHRLLDGKKRPVSGRWGNGCRFPGDPLAPLGETINCRCWTIYSPI